MGTSVRFFQARFWEMHWGRRKNGEETENGNGNRNNVIKQDGLLRKKQYRYILFAVLLILVLSGCGSREEAPMGRYADRDVQMADGRIYLYASVGRQAVIICLGRMLI